MVSRKYLAITIAGFVVIFTVIILTVTYANHQVLINSETTSNIPINNNNNSNNNVSRNFLPLGIPDNNVQFSIINSGNTSDLQSCISRCENDPHCIGVHYDNNVCTTLTDRIIIPPTSDIFYDPNLDSKLFLKKHNLVNNMMFEGRIFIGEFGNAIPMRSWLIKENDVYIQIVPNTVNRLKFFPRYIKIDVIRPVTGIYSLQPFIRDHAQILINNGNNHQVYIHEYGNPLQLPDNWKNYSPIYVMYVY